MFTTSTILLLVCLAAEGTTTKCLEGKILGPDNRSCHQGTTTKCLEGKILGPDNRSCHPTSGVVLLMLAKFRGIEVVADVTDEKLENYSNEDQQFILPVKTSSFDYDFSTRELFFYSDDAIKRYVPATGSLEVNEPVNVFEVDTKVTSIALDWQHDRLYWICDQKGQIQTVKTDGTDHKLLAEASDHSQAGWTDIAVDPYSQKLFWIGQSGLFISNLEGKYSVIDVSLQLERLAVDITNHLIYLVGQNNQSEDKVVARINYNGTEVGKRINLGQANSKVFGFGVVDDTLYWESNHDIESIYKCTVPSPGEKVTVTRVRELGQIVYSMKIWHPKVQKYSVS